MPSARAAGLRVAHLHRHADAGGGFSTSPRKAVRWRARSSRLRHGGHDVDEAEQRGLELLRRRRRGPSPSRRSPSADCGSSEARAASRRPTSNSSRSSAASSTMPRSLRPVRWPRWSARSGCSASSPRCTRRRRPSPRFVARVAAALEGVDYELILVDDGSKDAHGGGDGRGRRGATRA